MRASAALAWVVLLTACGRTEPLRYLGDEVPGSPSGRDDAWLTCPSDRQSFALPPMPKRDTDVLLVVDDSGSMEDDQAVLADNFHSFISAFESEGVDFHLGAVTTDMTSSRRSGRLVAPFLTRETPDVENAFREMVQVGSGGSATECGLSAARAALSDPLASNENRDFLRPEANLAVVFLTDEPDQSGIPADEMVSFLKGLKSEPATVSVIGILGLRWYFLCERLTASWAYAQVARAFGPNGMVVSCSGDFAKRMSEMGVRIVNARCMVELTRPIGDGQPRVTLNGTPVPYVTWPPDAAHPNGTLEIQPCPPGGGEVEVIEPYCP